MSAPIFYRGRGRTFRPLTRGPAALPAEPEQAHPERTDLLEVAGVVVAARRSRRTSDTRARVLDVMRTLGLCSYRDYPRAAPEGAEPDYVIDVARVHATQRYLYEARPRPVGPEYARRHYARLLRQPAPEHTGESMDRLTAADVRELHDRTPEELWTTIAADCAEEAERLPHLHDPEIARQWQRGAWLGRYLRSCEGAPEDVASEAVRWYLAQVADEVGELDALATAINSARAELPRGCRDGWAVWGMRS